MSFIDQFSIGFKFKKEKIKKTFDYYSEKQSKFTNLIRTKTFTRKGNLSAKLAQELVSLGYNLDSIMSLMKINNFSNVEEALNLLEKDPITKLYNHYFFPQIDDSCLQRSKSEKIISQKNDVQIICRICGGTKEEHIDEKDEYNKELSIVKKKYEHDQYYGSQSSNLNNNFLMNEKNNMKMKIKAIERVRSLGNNINKDNKGIIVNLNNNINKYYINNNNKNNNNNNDNEDYSQSHMIMQNPKAKSGTNINTLLILNKYKLNKNKNLYNNYINTFEDNRKKSQNNIEIEHNILNTEGSKKILINQKPKLIFDSKTDLKEDNINNEKTNEKIDKKEVIDSESLNDSNIKELDNIEDNLNIKLEKYGINQDTINQFKDPEICIICFENKINKENIAQKCCLHYFCDQCIKNYLTYQINNGVVLELKCLMAGCPHLYTSEEIRANVTNEIYRKYLRFYGIQIKIRNPDKIYINCPFVDCDELVDVTNIPEGNVICGVGHVFCRDCLKIGGHSKNNSVCKKNELNLDLYNELKQKNPSKIHQNYKQCPICKVLIEKIDGCNQMKCLNCGYNFCWLCMREYTYNHYSIYNVKGCPGMRFETVKTYKIRNNPCLNFLWYMLSCFLYILFFISIYIFYFFAGCPYEFVKCYLERKKNKENDSKSNIDSIEIDDDNINELGIDNGYNGLSNSVNQSNKVNGVATEEKENNKYIIWLIIFVGILCQPLYLSFYAIYTLIECYKRFNCMFYFPR